MRGWMSSSSIGILGFAALVFVFNLVGYPEVIKTFDATRNFLTLGWTMNDSWAPMALAAEYLIENPGGDQLYQQIFFVEKIKFQYPPTSLLLPYYFHSVFAENAAILRYMSWMATALTICISVLIFAHASPTRAGEKRSDLWIRVCALSLLGLMFYPIMHSHLLGQIQTFLTAMFALLLYSWLKGWKVPAGILLGLMCLIKPQYGLILVWAVLRREWRFAGSAVAIGTLGLAISIALFGARNYLGYLEVLRYLSRHGEAFYPNQSMNGLLNRLIQNGESLVFQLHVFAPYHSLVHKGALLFAAVLVLATLVLPVVWRRQGSTLDLSAITLSATIASPIAWEHHYGILLPIFAFLLGSVMGPTAFTRRPFALLLVMGVSYLLCSTFIFGTTALAHMSHLNVLMSYLFFGALLALGCLLHMMRASNANQDQGRQGAASSDLSLR